jgi:hypothetical protein
MSGGSLVLVDQAAQDRFSADLADAELPGDDAGRIVRAVGDALADALMRPGGVVVLLVFGQDGSQVRFAEDEACGQGVRAAGCRLGLVAGGGPMARLPRVMGRGRALEVLLSADDIRGDDAELLGYVNRALPDAELDNFVGALATRIASFDKWAIANTKRLVNEASLPPDVEIRAGWDACMASVKRPAAQERIKALLEQGLQKPGDSENRLGFYVGRLRLNGER